MPTKGGWTDSAPRGTCLGRNLGRLYVHGSIGQTDPMHDTEELKRALGPAAHHYNETQLQHLSRELDLAAEFLLDLYAHTRARQPEKNGRADLTESSRVIG
jgi:hypothetical protein